MADGNINTTQEEDRNVALAETEVPTGSSTPGKEVKNAAIYSTSAYAIAAALVTIFVTGSTYSESEVAIITGGVAVIVNLVLVVLKKLMDRV